MFHSKSYFLVLMAFALTVHPAMIGETAEKKLTFPLPSPPTIPLKNFTQCRCKAIVGSMLVADSLAEKEVRGEVFTGTDEVSIEIKEKTLYFLSSASFEIGAARPAEYSIVHNTESKILAVDGEPTNGGYTVHVITINKENGLAVWTKTRASDLFSGGNPSAQSYLMKCQ